VDPLERLALAVDFRLYLADLGAALERSDRLRGRRPYDADMTGSRACGFAGSL
jgi:hypothetical protein